jgi:putative transposase
METGYDAGKKTKGRKRHLLVDTRGNILNVIVHRADIQDRDGCKLLLRGFNFKTITKIFVDGGYAGKIIDYVKKKYGIILEVVKRTDLHKFVILKKRWIVERTNSWMTTSKRLTRDYENKTKNQEEMIYLRMSQILLNRHFR